MRKRRPPESSSPQLPKRVANIAVDRSAVPESLRSTKYTVEELLDLRAESAAARELGIRWADRGPTGEVPVWRGQQWRPGSERYANRGGANKEWYTQMYRAKAKGKDFLAKWLADNPKPSSASR
jgi:hypothetical protein